MAVADERLLEMASKRLEVNDRNALEDYAKYAKRIYENKYKEFMSKMTTTDYYSLPFDEQLTYLIELSDEYDRLSTLREEYNNTYKLYTQESLELSDLSNILIDNIRERISILQGYLINKKNIVSNKRTLEALNEGLIKETKSKKSTLERLVELEKELIKNFTDAEGRRQKNDGSLEYTSVQTEYQNEKLDFVLLLNDNNLLQRLLDETTELLYSAEETLAASHVCYTNMPNLESKRNYDISLKDAIKLRYKLTLLQIAETLSSVMNNANNINYATFKEIREKLKTLIAYRRDCLDRLGIKFLIDPFDKTKIDNQLEVANTLGDSDKVISSIKGKIQSLVTTNEQMEEKNTDYYNQLTKYLPLYKDITSMNDIIDIELPKIEEPVIELPTTDIKTDIDEVKPNKVIKIADIYANFNNEHATTEAHNVISRVLPMFAEPIENQLTLVDNVNEPNDEAVELPIQSAIDEEQPESLPTIVEFNTYSKPFIETTLFTNRSDDDVFEKQVPVSSMEQRVEFTDPDKIFSTPEQVISQEDNESSFWPAIGEEKTPTKTLKRVA